MTSTEALVVLNAIPGMTGMALKSLISACDQAPDIFKMKQEDMIQIGLSLNLAINIVHFPKDKFLEAEYNLLHNQGVSIVTIYDEDYPALLNQICHPPYVLYIKGNRSLLQEPSIAMVGARKASHYGIRMAQEFAAGFAQAGLAVVSGGASGIDTASHQGCLKTKGHTMAVLGCGLSSIYPFENKNLFERIAAEGALISEFPMSTKPLMYNFPRRNRIISGLSLATLVIEAAAKSGSLITADYALEQNREVFAVPGNIDSLYSEGTNHLIQEGSKIALSVMEVLEQLGLGIQNQLKLENINTKEAIVLSEEEMKIYEHIQSEPIHIDSLHTYAGSDSGYLMQHMLNLEIKGIIKQLPGQYYIRT